MFVEFLFYVFVIISAFDIAHFCLYLTGANLYDMQHIRATARRRKAGPRQQAAPLVSVLIPAHNEAAAIVRCLDSVAASSYEQLQIIVIDDASRDTTRTLVKEYMASHPDTPLELLWKRKNVGKAAALNHALTTTVKGELVMTLDADSVLGVDSIASAVNYFDDPKIVGVAANVRVMDSSTLLGLLQKFEYLVGYRTKKFYSVTNSEFIIGGVASTYRMSTLRRVGFYSDDVLTEDIDLSMKIASHGNKAHHLVYGVDVVAMTEGVQSFQALLSQRYRWKMGNMQCLLKYSNLLASTNPHYTLSLAWYRIPVAFLGEVLLVLQPFVIGFIIFVCLQTMSTGMIFGAYLTITAYLLWNIAHDEHLSFGRKLRMSGYAPIMYFIGFTMNVVQLYAVFRCLSHPRQILRQTHVSSKWISPARSGKPQIDFS